MIPTMTQDEVIEVVEHAVRPVRADVARITDRSLAVFQQIGRLEAAAVRAESSASNAERAAMRCEAAASRMESFARRLPSIPPPPAHDETVQRYVAADGPRRRLESIVEFDDADPTGVRDLKDNVASLVAERDAAQAAVVTELKAQVLGLLKERDDSKAVSTADARRMRLLARILGIIVASGAAWAIVRAAVPGLH